MTEQILENEYKIYLDRVSLKLENMTSVQKVETKRAFFGGVSSLLVLLHTKIADIQDEEKAVVALDVIWEQCELFWKNELLNKYE